MLATVSSSTEGKHECMQAEQRQEGDNPQSSFLYEYQPQVAHISTLSTGGCSLSPPAVCILGRGGAARGLVSCSADPATGWLQLTSLLQTRIQAGDAGGLDVVTRGPSSGGIAGEASCWRFHFGDQPSGQKLDAEFVSIEAWLI